MKTYTQHTYIHILMILASVVAIILSGAGPTAAQTTIIARDTFSTNNLNGGEFAWAVAPWWTGTNATVNATGGSLSLQAAQSPTSAASRPVSLAGSYTSITLRFDFTQTAFDTGEALIVQVNGAQVASFDRDNTGTRTVDLTSSASLAQPITLTFTTNANQQQEYAYIDNIVIEGVQSADPTATPTATPTQPAGNQIAEWCFVAATDFPAEWGAAPAGCNIQAPGIGGAADFSLQCFNPATGVSPQFSFNGTLYPSLELTFFWVAGNLNGNETITIDASLDGGVTWEPNLCAVTSAELVAGSTPAGDPSVVNTATCTLTGYPAGTYPAAQIRFNFNGLDAGQDYMVVDCIRLNGLTSVPTPTPTPTQPVVENCVYEWNFEDIITNGWTVVTGCNGIDPAAPDDNYLECARNAGTVTTVQITTDVPPDDNCLTFEWRGRALTMQNANDDDDFVVHISPNADCSGGEDLVCYANVSDVAAPNTGWTATTCGIPATYDDTSFYLCFDFGTLENNEYIQIDDVDVCEGVCPPGPQPTATPGAVATCPPWQTPDDGEVPNPAAGWPDLSSHGYPTYLFIASYDWLHNFTDRNTAATRGGTQRDPDTDNFNKIIVADSNLFPIMTSLVGDHEFPNITGRNSLSWAGGGRPSPSVNDYFNRGIAVASDFITKTDIGYSTLTSYCFGGNYQINVTQNTFAQYGGRSFMQWAFVTDPGNNNLRRYEFRKLGGLFSAFNAESGTELGVNEGKDAESVCGPSAYGGWATGETYEAMGNDYDPSTVNQRCRGQTWGSILGTIGPQWSTDCGTCTDAAADAAELTAQGAGRDLSCYKNEGVIWVCKHGQDPLDAGDETSTGTYNSTANTPDPGTEAELADFIANGEYWDYVELPIQTVSGYVSGDYTFDVEICGNSRESSSDIFGIGINTKHDDPRPTDHIHNNTTWGTFATQDDFYILDDWMALGTGSYRECKDYTITISQAYDLEPSTEGLQFRLRLYALQQGSFVMDEITVGDRDSAFTVKYTGPEAGVERRWGVLTSFLETVPPKSFPGYPIYTSPTAGIVGYGYVSNTSFTTAKNVRFKDPRDVDVYRDMFDPGNYGPVYIFVADSGNSRIQVFMNATGVAGTSNKAFPVRPVRVKGPQDTTAKTIYKSNELGPRLYTGVNRTAAAVGDGRKADWRGYTTFLGTTLANSTIPADAGRGDFYYPHGVAVDQDPNTKDVYLFVADTYNHRVQIFRDTTGVTFQGITSKRFDFKFAAGWGSYPLQTTLTITQPGSYQFRYPKGLDVTRFANNSSYLYVVDSKNYRVLKYLLSEGNAAQGLKDVKVVAGYGYNGATFATNLTTMMGTPLTVYRDFETHGAAALGFEDPQDIATGYSGFYLYSAPRSTNYPYQVTDRTGRPRGVNFLNNYMLYVTDLLRNYTTTNLRRMNMRVMQFMEHPSYNPATNSARGGFQGKFLPWDYVRTTAPAQAAIPVSKGTVGRSVFGPAPYGAYNSVPGANGDPAVVPAGQIWGSTNNAGRVGIYTDRPAGIAALSWDTVAPFDFRVTGLNTDGHPTTIYRNGTTIDRSRGLRVGVTIRQFFGLPANNLASFTNFTARDPDAGRLVDQRYATRVHIFCYNSTGAFQNHTALRKRPDPANTDVDLQFLLPQGNAFWQSCPAGGYMKVVAEDVHFGYSGKTGARIFRVQ